MSTENGNSQKNRERKIDTRKDNEYRKREQSKDRERKIDTRKDNEYRKREQSKDRERKIDTRKDNEYRKRKQSKDREWPTLERTMSTENKKTFEEKSVAAGKPPPV
ncbi:hypothetical protein BaRGS_00007211 [Batillaria attramentaria]|uniref:Uncharacterized protein n=1 Tax=Batillaria attramentaria TaxID=370345 RepID=A0ABD0LPA8_9CAEN